MSCFGHSRIVGLFCAGIALLLGASQASAAPVTATASDGFVDSIGVNVHATHYLGFSTTSYNDWPAVINALGDIGIRNVRDHILIWQNGDTTESAPDRLNQMTAATGAKVTAIIERHYIAPDTHYLQLDQADLPNELNLAKTVNGLIALEGPSEYNEYSDPDMVAHLKQYQIALYNAAKADPVLSGKPVIAPSLTDQALYPTFSDLAPYTDRGNIHSYPRGFTPTTGLAGWLSTSAQMVGPKPTWATETGYIHGPLTTKQFDISMTAAAKYMPRLLMEYFRAGVEKTFIYELLDDNVDPGNTNSENHFGLFNTDFTYKPAGTAVKNLISLLKDPGSPVAPSSLDYTITGGNADLHTVLLKKRDGTFWLALWQDVSVFDKPTNTDLTNPDLPVTIDFASDFLSAVTYLPDGSTLPTGAFGPGSQLHLNVPDQVMLVQITPLPEPSSMLALAAGTFLLARRRRIAK
jgi:hypothetical protein